MHGFSWWIYLLFILDSIAEGCSRRVRVGEHTRLSRDIGSKKA